MKQNTIRRSGIRIMASLVVLLGSLFYVMILAVINGSIGFLAAMGVTVSGAVGVAKAMGEQIPLSWGAIMALAVGCGVVRGGLRYLEQYGNHYIAFRLLAVLRDRIFTALRTLCPAKLENKQKGNIIAMITSDIETLEVFYAHTLSPVCIAVLVSTGVFVFVGAVSSWWLALTALAGYLLIGVCMPILSAKRLKRSGVLYRNEFALFNAFFLDSIRGIRDIVLHRAEQLRLEEINVRSARLCSQSKAMKRDVARMGAATELLVSISVLVTVGIGILLVYRTELTAGRMLIGAAAVSSSFGPVLAISALPGNLTQTFASGDRLLNLLAEEPAVRAVKNGTGFSFEQLDVQGLSFSYDRQKEILHNICMHARKGEIVGIVGESGSGKSTLLRLLLRFWEKQEGVILYNGTDIDQIDTDSLLTNVTMVSQSTYLFDETIEENLKIAKPDATQEQMEQACRMASVHDLIMSLPQGYQTRVGTMGDRLSAGEKQRIGLARAFLRGSGLILLDEPTSNVDSINEGMILQSLLRQKGQRCILLVSHRESTMAIADRIYRMEDAVLHTVT